MSPALRALKTKLQREGVYRDISWPSLREAVEKRPRERAAAIRRARKLERKRMNATAAVIRLPGGRCPRPS